MSPPWTEDDLRKKIEHADGIVGQRRRGYLLEEKTHTKNAIASLKFDIAGEFGNKPSID
jgi:hypothetical protein